MKKSVLFVVLLSGIFIAAQLQAQVESNKQGNAQDTEVKTDTQTKKMPPPVKSSKTRPGSTSTSTSTTNTGNTQTGTATSPGKQTGTMTSSKDAAQPGKIYDASGNLLYTVDQLGWIRNPKNRAIAQYTANGEYIKKRTVIGKVENGVVRDRYGKELARIAQNGKVLDGNGNALGSIGIDGSIMDAKGAKIGSAPGVDKNVAVIVFLFQGNSLVK